MVSGGSDGSNRTRYLAALVAALFVSGITFGLLAYTYQLGNTSGYQTAEKDGYSQNGATTTKQAVAQCRLKPEPTLEECIAVQIIAGRDDHRSEQDLDAQRDMARWARLLLVVSLAQIPLGIAGLFALIYTIRQGREANDIARDSIKKQIRPYLAIQDLFVVDLSLGQSPNFKVKVINKGQSGAFKGTCLYTLTRAMGVQKDAPIYFSDKKTRKLGTIAPDGFMNLSLGRPTEWTTNQSQAIIDGDVTIFFTGVLSYRDSFGRRYLTTFHAYTDCRNPSGQMQLSERGNSAN